MKDYTYARSLLGAVGFVVWLGFLVGVILAFMAARTGSPLSIAMGVMTAVGVLLSTVMALAFVQVGRAIIDIAENTAAMASRGTLPPEQKREPQLRGVGTNPAEGLRAVRG